MDSVGRKVNKLFDMEFDEVSSVDRPANQHGLIAFSKSLTAETTEEGGVTQVFTEAGDPVTEDELEHGDVVFDEAGNEYVFVLDEDEDIDEIGKALAIEGPSRLARFGSRMRSRYMTSDAAKGAKVKGYRFDSAGNVSGVEMGSVLNRGRIARDAAIGGTAVGVGGGGAYMVGRKNVEKSLGDSVLEQLSKAVTEADREQIIAKALDEVEIAKAEAIAAQEELAYLQDERVTEAFIAKAAEYNLPVSPEVFGPILKAAATVLDEEQLDILDHVLTAAGEAMYEEIGFTGGGANSVFDQVTGFASEMVTKSAGDFTIEQASTAMFAANPEAYDAYIAEQNGR